jgi:phi LC3 family holin
MGIVWAKRLKSKIWWVSIITLLLLLSKQVGINFLWFIPSNYDAIINSIFLILGMLGVSVDTSNTGIADAQILSKTETTETTAIK